MTFSKVQKVAKVREACLFVQVTFSIDCYIFKSYYFPAKELDDVRVMQVSDGHRWPISFIFSVV